MADKVFDHVGSYILPAQFFGHRNSVIAVKGIELVPDLKESDRRQRLPGQHGLSDLFSPFGRHVRLETEFLIHMNEARRSMGQNHVHVLVPPQGRNELEGNLAHLSFGVLEASAVVSARALDTKNFETLVCDKAGVHIGTPGRRFFHIADVVVPGDIEDRGVEDIS